MSSDHTAIGQALGFSYQFERATYRLLEADNSVISVGVEHVDDVSVHRSDETSIREQDKSTIGSASALADRSVALWKTLSIWAGAVTNDPGITNTTEFHLVTTGSVDCESLIKRISLADDDVQADLLVTELLSMVPGLRADLRPFGKVISKLPKTQLSNLLKQVQVLDSRTATFGGSLHNLQSLRYLSEFQRVAVFNNASAWVRRSILAAAQNGEPTLVDRAGFDREVTALLRRVAAAPLSIMFNLPNAKVDPANYKSFGFFKQLEWIETDPEFVRDCVIHYAIAQATRVGWTDDNAVSEASLLAYQDDLKSRWKLQVRRETQKVFPSPVAQGYARLTETLSEDSALDGQPMPKAITCGNFHALANFDQSAAPNLGWHPDFIDLAKDGGGE